MKKILSLACAVVFSFGLVGCGGDSSSGPKVDPKEAQQKNIDMMKEKMNNMKKPG